MSPKRFWSWLRRAPLSIRASSCSSLAGVSTKAHGCILFWEGASLWILGAPAGERYPRTDVHSHHALQVTLALTGSIDFQNDVEAEAIAIAPDAPHSFEGTGLVAHLFVASDSQAGRAIVRRLCSERPIAPIPGDLLGNFPARLRATFEDPHHSEGELRALGRALIARLADEHVHAEAPDPRIVKVMAWVAPRLDQAVSLRDISAIVGLSEGRTRHLFVEQTGLSFRTYLLWLRLVRALEIFAAGASLTDAAHGSGFSDSAHLSRTFRRMFGINAASLRLS